MLDVRQVHHEVPELRGGYDEAAAFADFCRFLAGNAVETEARALTDAARRLLDVTTDSLAHDDDPEEPTARAPRQRRST
jgi:hypothetical protein